MFWFSPPKRRLNKILILCLFIFLFGIKLNFDYLYDIKHERNKLVEEDEVFQGTFLKQIVVDIEEDGLPTVLLTENKEGIQITHLFNSFNVKPGGQLEKEHALVQLSWVQAAKYAEKHYGIKVEFLNAVLEKDINSSPEFARIHVLKDEVKDPYTNHHLPTIGEIFKTGKEQGKGDIVIFTNADIGAMETFYVKMWKLAHLDTSSAVLQEKLFKECLELLTTCLALGADNGKPNVFSNREICQADVQEYFKLHGGWVEKYPQILRNLARMYTKLYTKSFGAEGNKIKLEKVRELYILAGGTTANVKSDIKSLEQVLSFIPERISFSSTEEESRKQTHGVASAFTVTRLDVRGKDSIGDATLEELAKIYHSDKVQPHPGNDCFVIPRKLIPDMLLKSRHPLSWRPWGMWIPHVFEWTYGKDKMIWRRFEGTPQNNYTFHLGVSGRVANNWVALFNQRPLFILSLVAEWNQVTNNQFIKLYEIPEYCEAKELYRNFEYCQHAPVHMRYCQGNVRYGCASYQHPHLRDTYNYNLACERMIHRINKPGQYLVEPYCSYCLSLMPYHGASEKRIANLNAKCNHNLQVDSCVKGKCNFKPSS